MDTTLRAGRSYGAEEAYSLPLATLDPGHPRLFQTDAMWPYFERLRAEAPVHHARKDVNRRPGRAGPPHAATARAEAA